MRKPSDTDDFYQAWLELETMKLNNLNFYYFKELYRVLCKYKEGIYTYNGEMEQFKYEYVW
jgi:hypothetical protein